MLMIPGPMDAPDEVLRRCGHQVFPHYDVPTGFPEFHNELAEKLKVVFGLDNGNVFIPSGNGTFAVNMALASFYTKVLRLRPIVHITVGFNTRKRIDHFIVGGFLPCSSQQYTAGNTNSVKIVELESPNTTTAASGL